MNKCTIQLQHRVASTRRISVSGFFSLCALLICAAVCSVAAGTILAFFHSEAPSRLSQRTLTFQDRVAYQRAIEEVYWRHRIWPSENAGGKPLLEAVMSQAQLEKKVEDYLQQPITSGQLQAEMDRMAEHTKQPEVLRELFDALGDDPFVIAECLARSVLTQRLTAALSAGDIIDRLQSARTKELPNLASSTTSAPALYQLPKISGGDPPCIDDTWTATPSQPEPRNTHTAVWTGSEMIIWGGFGGGNTGGRYNPSTDSWTATSTVNAPSARSYHTAVWTGSEMIVWGGTDNSNTFNTGGRYNPSTDTWLATSKIGRAHV